MQSIAKFLSVLCLLQVSIALPTSASDTSDSVTITSAEIAPTGDAAIVRINPSFYQAYEARMKFPKEKKRSQKLSVSNSKVASNSEKANADAAEQALLMESLVAANPRTLKVSFQFGKRTATNRQGIYVTAVEVQSEEPTR